MNFKYEALKHWNRSWCLHKDLRRYSWTCFGFDCYRSFFWNHVAHPFQNTASHSPSYDSEKDATHYHHSNCLYHSFKPISRNTCHNTCLSHLRRWRKVMTHSASRKYLRQEPNCQVVGTHRDNRHLGYPAHIGSEPILSSDLARTLFSFSFNIKIPDINSIWQKI